MPHTFALTRLALIVTVLGCATASEGAQGPLNDTLTPMLTRYQLPALTAAVVKGGKVIAAGAVGTRRAGSQIPVTVNDRFHLGSDTKALTALLAAMFVEAGQLRWDSTVADAFPELHERMDGGLQRVRLDQLLSHTSCIPSDNEAFGDLLAKSTVLDGNLDDMRYWLVQQWGTQPLVSQPLVSQPGTQFAYANMNYVLVGAMIERVAGKTWEELITERVFTPLGLRSAGLGPQATLGRIDAPLGHMVIDGKTKAFLAGPNGDNPLIIGPVGTAHMSILDFARWAGWNVGEGRRGPKLIRPETLRKLHTPVIPMPEKKDAAPGTPSQGRYALGWGELTVDWAAEPLLYNGGSNQKNLAHIWLAPNRDFAMVLATNISGLQADAALFALASTLYARFAAPKSGGTGVR